MAKPSRKKIFIFLGILLVVGAIVYFLVNRGKESTDDAAVEAHIVPVAAKVAGYVKVLNVTDNQQVKAGDIILEIDPIDYKLQLDAATASLEAAQAKLESSSSSLASTKVSAPSNVTSAQAQVDAAQANWVNAKADLERYQSMNKEAYSKQQLDSAVATELAAKSNLADARAKLVSAKTAPNTVAEATSNVKSLEAQLKEAQAQVSIAEENMKNTKIVAPIDGRITRKGVEIGTYVQPGQQLLSLVSNDYWVVANFKETQLDKMRPGQPVDIKIDAYSSKSFKGKVDSIQGGTGARFSAFPPENATGNFVKIVQRVPVKILFTEKPDATIPVGPGMSVTPTVDVR